MRDAHGHEADGVVVEFLTNGASPPQHIQKPRALCHLSAM